MLQKRRCWGIERFCLKIGLPDIPVISDNNNIGVLRVILRGASTMPFSALFVVYVRAFPNWAAMLKTEPARQKGRKWANMRLREWKMRCFPGLIGLSGKPIFSQHALIPQQRLFCLGTAFCMGILSFACVWVLNGSWPEAPVPDKI